MAPGVRPHYAARVDTLEIGADRIVVYVVDQPNPARGATLGGNMFTITESVVLLAQLLNRFELDVQPCQAVKPVAIATVRPSLPVRVVVRAKVSA